MKNICRLLLGVAGLSAVIYGFSVYQKKMEPPEIVTTQPPIIEVTPEILLAINRKLAIVKVDVPLAGIRVPFPDRTALWNKHSIEHGEFTTSGRLFVAFEPGHAESDGHHIEVTLGKPVYWGLDDGAFMTHVHTTSLIWSADPHFEGNARKMGRQMLLSEACKNGYYEKASLTAAVLMDDFIHQISPRADVVMHTTPATC